jgi:DNA-directed RNA polymerase subunit L
MSTPAAKPPTAVKTLAEVRAARAARGASTAATRGRPAARPAPAPAASTQVFQNVKQISPTEIRFRLTPTLVGYANTLRRIMITEVETVGFRADIKDDGSTADVKIEHNSTPMSNEMLAHRIGLLPVHVEKPLEWNPAEYTFTLDITNDSPEPRDVVAGDIKVTKDRGPEEEPLNVPNVEFFRPDPVTKDTALLAVLKGRVGTQEPERLAFTARATVGTGRENARFMPVTARCAYAYTLDDDPDRQKEFYVRWLQRYKNTNPTELESNEAKKGEFEREFKTMEVQRCYKMDERGEPYSFDFQVESVGVLPPRYIVARAMEVLQAKLLKYASLDTGDLPEGVKVIPSEARMKGYDFWFKGEDHTLGNLLQTWMDANMMDKRQISFVGYKVPHPLRDEMVLRVGVDFPTEPDRDGKQTVARAMVAKAARDCAQMFTDWREMWAGVTVEE